jgi:hypothetical protein
MLRTKDFGESFKDKWAWLKWIGLLIVFSLIGLGVIAFLNQRTEQSHFEDVCYSIEAAPWKALDNNGDTIVPFDSKSTGKGTLCISPRLERVCVNVLYGPILPTEGDFNILALYGPITGDEPNTVSTPPVLDFLVNECEQSNVKTLAFDKATRYRGCLKMDTRLEKKVLRTLLKDPTSYYLEAQYTGVVASVSGDYTIRDYLGKVTLAGVEQEPRDYPAFPKCIGSTPAPESS